MSFEFHQVIANLSIKRCYGMSIAFHEAEMSLQSKNAQKNIH